MSRIDELKKQYREYALSDIDILKMVMPNNSSKYVEMSLNLIRNVIDTDLLPNQPQHRSELIREMSAWGVNRAYLESLDVYNLTTIYNRIYHFIGYDKIKTLFKFINLNERNLINNKDVTSYKSFNEVLQAISLADLKLIDKELEKQIIKVYEDDEWLLLKPLSLEASMKYGANTKWCTTMESGIYFSRYSTWGILIYAINKRAGFKFATFKNLDLNREREFSFWNAEDHRVEPLDTYKIPIEIIGVIRDEVRNNPVTNKSLMNEELQKALDSYKEPEYPVQAVLEPGIIDTQMDQVPIIQIENPEQLAEVFNGIAEEHTHQAEQN